MKKSIHLLILLGTVGVMTAACDKEKLVSADQLPADAQAYITRHFPEHGILQVIKERDDLKTTFDVYLNEGYNLDFDKKGKILSVEGSSKVPDSVVPENILAYVKSNYPDHFILDWEKDDQGQEVSLSNGIELRFGKSGDFLRIN